MGPASTENLKGEKRKSRLSTLFGSKKEDKLEHHEIEPMSQDNNQLETQDSAYGGSEPPSNANSTREVPTITSSEANAQGAKVKTEIDRTGRTITTTTTTTTTTVTTLSGDHYDVPAGSDVLVTKDVGPIELSARPLSAEISPAITGAGANSEQVARQDHANLESLEPPPTIPARDNRRSMSPARIQQLTENGAPSPLPESPGRHNFSYPARAPPATGLQKQPSYPSGTPQVPQQHNHPQQQHSPPNPGRIPPLPFQNERHYQQQSQPHPGRTPPHQFQNQQAQHEQPQHRQQSLHQSQQQPQHLPNTQSRNDAFNPQIPPRYGSAAPSDSPQYQAYQPPNAQNSSRPRPPVEPSHGQSRVDGAPGEYIPPNQRVSTVQNLKTAAAGIHGAGEALRGVINSTVDKRTGAPPERLAANEAVINRGRQEIATGQYQHRQRPEPVVQQQDHLSLPPQEEKKKGRFRNVLKRSQDPLKPVSEESVQTSRS